ARRVVIVDRPLVPLAAQVVQVFDLFRGQRPGVRPAGQHLVDAVAERLQQEAVPFVVGVRQCGRGLVEQGAAGGVLPEPGQAGRGRGPAPARRRRPAASGRATPATPPVPAAPGRAAPGTAAPPAAAPAAPPAPTAGPSPTPAPPPAAAGRGRSARRAPSAGPS